MAASPIPIPDGIIIGNVKLNHNIPQFSTTSLNLKRNGKERNLHQLSGTFDINVYDERAQRRLESWIIKMRGRYNYFQLKLGGRFDASDHVRTNPTAAVDIGIGANVIPHTGMVGKIWEGDMFTLLNDNKIYIVTNDVNDSSTNIEFYPPARTAQLTGSEINFEEVILSAQFEEDMQTITYSENGLIHTMTCTWVEYLG